MKKHLTYILGISVAALSACSDDAIEGSKFLNGTEKTPIAVSALLDKSNGAQTRATDMEFDNNDVLIAYLRHVTWDGTNLPAPLSTPQELLVSFEKGSKVMEAYDGSEIKPVGLGGTIGLGIASTNTQQTSDLTATPAIYWDDFSVGAKGDATDLRTDGHYLESFYGYCYNGGAPTTTLVNATGVLGWTVDDDQFTNGIKTSDLLWSCEQNPIKYNPGAAADDPHGTLILPYTHAMSKVTIEIELGDGFDKNTDGSAKAFGTSASARIATTPTLFANRVTTTTAPAYTHSTTVASDDAAKIQMRLADDETTKKKNRVYEAIIAPTVMKDGQTLAEVTVDGNTYKINLTDAILNPAEGSNKWSSQLKAYTISGSTLTKDAPESSYIAANGGITLPGVNYRIKVTLNKQEITVVAYIKKWDDVTASTTGTISFNADVKESDVKDATSLLTSGSFDLWRATANTAETDYDYNSETASVIDKASTYEYNRTTEKWEAMSGNDVLYWDNATTSYYFRALAKAKTYNSDGIVTEIKSVGGSTTVSQGTKAETVDLLWAQTSKHEAKDANGNWYIDEKDPSKHKLYGAGDAINPRTGDVPLTFEHAMSKISVVLQTSDVETEKVDLTDATISIINLYNGGTIGVHDGLVTELTAPDPGNGGDPMTVKGIAHTAMTDFLVVPQSLVYLKDGTTERSITPIFYSADELTAIYPEANIEYAGSQNTSIGTGTPSYYLTRELTAVPAVHYADNDEDKAIIYAFNKTLDGHKVEGNIEIPEVDQVDYDYDGFITDQHHKTFTSEIFNSLPDAAKVKIKHQDAIYYETLEDFHTYINNETKYLELPAVFRAKSYYNCQEYNEAHSSELSEDEFLNLPNEQKIKDYYNYAEFLSAIGDVYILFTTRLNDDSILPKAEKQKTPEVQQVLYTYDEYINLDKIEQDMFVALPADLKIKIPHADAVLYTEETANAFNLTLPGAKHVGDIKIPAHYALPSEGTLTPHNAGDLSVVGNKIVMYIFLKDGTRYSAELSTCLDTTGTAETNPNYGKPVTQWKRNEHYTYTITLTKENIFFRALVKGWEEKKVGGNATLDWD